MTAGRPTLNELAALAAETGPVSAAELRRHSTLWERYRSWCRRALAETHLATVASHVCRTLRFDLSDLADLGIPVDVLQWFPAWAAGSRKGFRPRGGGLKPAPAGADQPVGWLRVQLSPAAGTIPYALTLLRDLLRRLDPSVRFTVVVEPGGNLAGLRRLVKQFHAGAAGRAEQRVHFAELRSMTLFAQDNARPARDASGNPVLLIPRAFRRGDPRAEDELAPEEAERAFGIPVVRSQLYWEGGNLVQDGERCLVGVDTIAENVCRLGLSAAEVLALFTAELGCVVVPLGELSRARFDVEKDRLVASGQAAFHLDLDVSLLGRWGKARRPRALVADAARGLEFLPAVRARRNLGAGLFLPASQARQLIETEYDAYARQRHPQLLAYAATLEQLGYRVIGVPDLRIDPRENLFGPGNLDFGYCNVLPGLCRGRPAVYYLPWGIRALDREARQRLQSAGVVPVRVSSPRIANGLMSLCGGLHCFCGRLT